MPIWLVGLLLGGGAIWAHKQAIGNAAGTAAARGAIQGASDEVRGQVNRAAHKGRRELAKLGRSISKNRKTVRSAVQAAERLFR